MLKYILPRLLGLTLLCLLPKPASAAELCPQDYAGYIPVPGNAYEGACRSSTFVPCLSIGVLAFASAITVIVLINNGSSSGRVFNIHSE
jgi:hypothetical protein